MEEHEGLCKRTLAPHYGPQPRLFPSALSSCLSSFSFELLHFSALIFRYFTLPFFTKVSLDNVIRALKEDGFSHRSQCHRLCHRSSDCPLSSSPILSARSLKQLEEDMKKQNLCCHRYLPKGLPQNAQFILVCSSKLHNLSNPSSPSSPLLLPLLLLLGYRI